MQVIKIGTRGSPLALWQAKTVEAGLRAAWPALQTELVIIKTSGDWAPEQGEVRLSTQAGGKRQFATEIEAALAAGEIDIAVHSMKDMDSKLPGGMEIAAMLPRADARDAVLLRDRDMADMAVADWPAGFVVGTASVRRGAMLLAQNPDLKIVPLRGNVETRISKLRGDLVVEHDLGATLLAVAGLKRLELGDEIDQVLGMDEMLPSAGQGAVGIEVLAKNSQLKELLAPILCMRTVLRVEAERAALAVLDGSCHTPIGAHAIIDDDGKMDVRIAVYALDGSAFFEEQAEAVIVDIDAARDFGAEIAARLKARLPDGFLAQELDGVS